MVELDAGVDHGDIHVDPLVVGSIDGDGRVVGSEDSLDPGRQRLCRDGVRLIRLDVCNRWVPRDRRRSGGGQPDGETAEGMRVHEADGSAVRPRQRCCSSRHIGRPGLEHDDVRARGCSLGSRRPGRADRRDQRYDNKSRARSRHEIPRSVARCVRPYCASSRRTVTRPQPRRSGRTRSASPSSAALLLAGDLHERTAIPLREERVAVDVEIDLGEHELVGERKSRGVDLGAADDEDAFDVREGTRAPPRPTRRAPRLRRATASCASRRRCGGRAAGGSGRAASPRSSAPSRRRVRS